MKNDSMLKVFCWALLWANGLALTALGQAPLPSPSITAPRTSLVTTSFVFDDARLLTEKQRLELNATLARHNQRRAGTLFLCLIEQVPQNFTAEQYADARLWMAQSPDAKDYDAFEKRALLLVVAQEKSVWIATGNAATDALTKAECKQICRQVIHPLFERGQYQAGLQAGLAQMSRELTEGKDLMRATALRGGLSFLSLFGYAGYGIGVSFLSVGKLLLLYGGVFFLLILLHEAAHAAVARLMGLSVTWVSIGCGKTLLTFQLAGMRIQLNLFPLGGATAISIPPNFRGGNPAFALALSVFAGPATHLVILILFLCFAPEAKTAWPSGSWQSQFLTQLYFLNNLNLFVNLLPIKQLSMEGLAMSDGYHLLRLITERAEVIETYRQAYFVFQAEEHKQAERYAEAAALYQQGLAAHPDQLRLMLPLSGMQKQAGEFEAARQTLLAAQELSQKSEHTMLRPAVLNDLAYADALINRPELLAEADAHSQEALRLLSHEPAVIGTRGAVLLRMGKIEEGLRLLNVAYQRYSKPQQRAEEACWLALGEALRHNFAAADGWWRVAQGGQPKAYLVKLIQRELQILHTQHHRFALVPTATVQLALAHPTN
jgi:uncharacterized membrane protein YgcG/tetratricopeptide (TPR) repeat protein